MSKVKLTKTQLESRRLKAMDSKHSSKELRLLKIKAKELFEVQGLSQALGYSSRRILT